MPGRNNILSRIGAAIGLSQNTTVPIKRTTVYKDKTGKVHKTAHNAAISNAKAVKEGKLINHDGKVYTPYENAMRVYEETEQKADAIRGYYNKWFNATHTESIDYPYMHNKAITLHDAGRASGVTISTNQLDSIAKYASLAGMPFDKALGFGIKESTLGNGTLFNSKESKELIDARTVTYESEKKRINSLISKAKVDGNNYNIYEDELKHLDKQYKDDIAAYKRETLYSGVGNNINDTMLFSNWKGYPLINPFDRIGTYYGIRPLDEKYAEARVLMSQEEGSNENFKTVSDYYDMVNNENKQIQSNIDYWQPIFEKEIKEGKIKFPELNGMTRGQAAMWWYQNFPNTYNSGQGQDYHNKVEENRKAVLQSPEIQTYIQGSNYISNAEKARMRTKKSYGGLIHLDEL